MKLYRRLRGRRLFLADLFLIAASVVASFALRLNVEQFFLDYLWVMFAMVLIALLVKSLIYRRMGLYRRVWAYASVEEMKLIVIAVSLASLVVGVIMLLLFYAGVFNAFSRSVLVIDWLFSLASIGALRFSLRLLAEGSTQAERGSPGGTRGVLVVGAGNAGSLVVRELQKNARLGLTPLAFLDDDPDILGHQIHGVPVAGTLDDLPEQVRQRSAAEVIVAIPSAPGSVLRRVAELCQQANVPFRTMPGIYELIGGTVSVSRLREVDITDLLRRQPARLDRKRVGASLKGRCILVTGAGGSIASELCRQVARWGPTQLVLVGHGENSIFEILLELDVDFPKLEIQPVIADVRDRARIERVVQRHKPDMIFHAAAHKHVPLMELNPAEAVTNNVLGTHNVVAAAEKYDVPRLVMISTDKAVHPSSVMGATKRIAEWIVLDAARRTRHPYSVVRFGNVLGSRGSVVPKFNRQIAAGGPITVTHPDMERYFMTIPEAVHLVLQSATFDGPGRMYILNMGDPVRIADLATDLIRLSGLEPGEDIQITYTGLRAGEKLTEELWEPGADYQPTAHPDISQVSEADALSGAALKKAVKGLVARAQSGDDKAVLKDLESLLPGAEIGRTPPPDPTAVL